MTVPLWLPVVGWEGLYEVSRRGAVRSLDRWVNDRRGQRRLNGCELRPALTSGYPMVHLYRDGHGEAVNVHALVLTAFAGECPAGMEALHGSMGPTVNYWPENLSWGTREDNQGRDRVRDHTTNRGEHQGAAKLTWDDVCEIRRLCEETSLTLLVIGTRFGVSRHEAGRIKRGVIWKYPPDQW